MPIKDSGSRSKFDTGAHRDCSEGKGRMDLLPYWALMEVSKVFEEGAKKYRANNWRRGIPLSRYADSGMRHMAKWMAGWRDEPHLAQAAWNLLCLMETQELIRQGLLPESLNDLPYNPVDAMENPNNISPLNVGGEGAELDEVGRINHSYSWEEVAQKNQEIADKTGDKFYADQLAADTSEMDAKIQAHRDEMTEDTSCLVQFVLKDSDKVPSFKELVDDMWEKFKEERSMSC